MEERHNPMTGEDRFAAEFDPRLADVWLAIFQSNGDPGDLLPNLGWFLRMAYLQGYEDALSEADRGALFKRLGIRPPERKPSRPRRTKR